jgi:hypothetical protein
MQMGHVGMYQQPADGINWQLHGASMPMDPSGYSLWQQQQQHPHHAQWAMPATYATGQHAAPI